jgi:hypothetical protein
MKLQKTTSLAMWKEREMRRDTENEVSTLVNAE